MLPAEIRFFELAAKGFAASTKLYNVRSVVHLENMNDRWFWQELLQRFRPGKYKFRGSSPNYTGNESTGCTQCLKYLGFLSDRFFVCIDSDFRYLMQEKNIHVSQRVLQTYTYSWENHCALAETLQRKFEELCPEKARTFDFTVFLSKYSSTVYIPFLYLLNTLRLRRKGLNRTEFSRALAEHFEINDEINNGEAVVLRIQQKMQTLLSLLPDKFMNEESEKKRYEELGVTEHTAYLFVRGHCLYDYLLSLGKHLCMGTGVDFEIQILKRSLSMHYAEMNKIEADIKNLI